MKAYTFGYKGLRVGGAIVVLASSEEKARAAAAKALYPDIPEWSLSLYEDSPSAEVEDGLVVYNDNGDL